MSIDHNWIDINVKELVNKFWNLDPPQKDICFDIKIKEQGFS